MKYIFTKVPIVLCAIFSLHTQAQEISVYDKNESAKTAIKPDAFDYIDHQYDVQKEDYIASLSGYIVTYEEETLINLFNSLWKKANDLGANSYRIEKVRNENDTIEVKLSVYNLSDRHIEDVLALYPHNMVYVFGDIHNDQRARKIRFNDEKLVLHPMEFIAYQNKVGQEATLNVGGILGAKIWIQGKENRLPVYLSLSGYEVRPDVSIGLGVSINTGRIYPVDMNFGQFLINVLKEKI